MPTVDRARRDPRDTLEGRWTWRDWPPILLAAVVALLLGAALILLVAHGSPYQRADALRALAGAVVWLAASVIGSCSTIAALMLTTLGLLEHLDTRRLTPRFLFRLRLVVTAAIATIGLAIAALLLTVFPAPAGGAPLVDTRSVNLVYWLLVGATALMIGGFALVLAALAATIRAIFRTLPTEWVDEILTEEGGEAR